MRALLFLTTVAAGAEPASPTAGPDFGESTWNANELTSALIVE